ncbi:hypothetical protein [Blastococcus sp. TF02A-30]|uniref:hypothetical protein n=1 Tax=Blastococcus sp. TF02A-30 TaxID=2250580 RepID=UPI00131498A3|nr:hypothetical protein [Blastococcus sp. TF02A-30]
MRRHLSVARGGLAAAAVVLLSACGGGSGEESGDAASSSSASASETSAGGSAGSDFCTGAAAVQERIGATLQGDADVSSLPQVLQEAVTELRALDAPGEIAGDWTALTGALEQAAAGLSSIDLADPNALTALQEQLAPLQDQLADSSANVEQYLREECGIAVDETAPAAPTS